MQLMNLDVDILESRFDREVLDVLLKDHTTSSTEIQHNILWATSDYEHLGDGYKAEDEISYDLISNNSIIIPRVIKDRQQQNQRSRAMAEVFTPSWLCNAQNNLVDEAWFGVKPVFNEEMILADGTKVWKTITNKIIFPPNRNWMDYVKDVRLEGTCGEAPYLASRYDCTTGESIPVMERIGLLDRKLRIICENTETSLEFLKATQLAYESVYGYEFQGDNLLLARESLLCTFIDYYHFKFKRFPQKKSIKYIAYIISWNLWQMDGLKGIIPNSCKPLITEGIFGEKHTTPCVGCLRETFENHTGTYCLIKDWSKKDPSTKRKGKKIRYIDCLK